MTRRSDVVRAILLALAAGCGGGSGGSGAPPDPPDLAAPKVALAFPPPDGTTDRPTIVVDGTASDDTGVALVTVNGVDATSDDGFRTWRAEVPLVRGANGLVVEARDAAGNTASDTGAVERTDPVFVTPSGLALDEPRGRALVVDRSRLLGIDLATGERSELALSGAAFEFADRIAVDEALGIAYVGQVDRVFRVDLATGATVLLSGGGAGAGVGLARVDGLRVDPASGDLYAGDGLSGFVCRVDLQTGNRTLLPVGHRGRDFVMDLPRNRVIEAVLSNGWFAVGWDLDTGAIDVLSGQAVGAGPNPASFGVLSFQGHAFDGATQTLWAVGDERPVVFEWDLASGDRRVLSGGGVAGGPEMIQPRAMALDAARGRLLVADAGLDAVVAVDLLTGERSVLSGVVRGAGPPVFGVRDLALAPDGRLFVLRDLAAASAGTTGVLASRRDEILVLDGANRAGLPPLSGAKIVSPRSIAFDATAARLLVSDAGGGALVFDEATGWVLEEGEPALVGIDPASGAVTVISDAAHGAGPMFVAPDRVAFGEEGVLVLDAKSKAVFRVDLATGDRTIVSNQLVGGGAEFRLLIGLDVDAATDRAIVSDGFLGIVSVDAQTGDRTSVASLTGGSDLSVDALGRRAFLAGATALHVIDIDAGGSVALPGTGPALLSPRAVLYEPVLDVVLAGDPNTASIVAISPRTGERVIVAK